MVVRDRWTWRWMVAAAAAAGCLLTSAVGAAVAPALVSGATSYFLLNGSTLLDDCPPCARPTILEPMRGQFELRLVAETPLGSRYDLTNIVFTAGTSVGRNYQI